MLVGPAADVFAEGRVEALPADKLVENAASLISAVIKAKPAVAKGKYVRSATLCSTMSPGISIDVTEFIVKVAS